MIALELAKRIAQNERIKYNTVCFVLAYTTPNMFCLVTFETVGTNVSFFFKSS